MFQVFRKHQKRWLTALTIFTMVLFAFPFGSTYFGGSDRPKKTGSEVVETIFNHRITEDDILRARHERFVANTFFQVMMSTVQPEWASRWGGVEIFGPSRDEEATKDAIRLSYKADQLGVRVSNETVQNWINRMTDGKLTNAQFDRTVATVSRVAGGVGTDAIFESLKQQLRIDRVQELVTGRFGDGPNPVTPYESWRFYQKLNDRLGMEVIPVHVAKYALAVDDPGDTALRELYNKYIGRLPDPASPEPGFKEPRRVNLQHASVALSDFTLAMRPEITVTDEEIKEYYEDRKDLYRVRPTAPTLAPTGVPAKPEDVPDPEKEKKEPVDPGKDPESKPVEGEKKSESPAKEPDRSDNNAEKPESQDDGGRGGPRTNSAPASLATGTQSDNQDDGKKTASGSTEVSENAEKQDHPKPADGEKGEERKEQAGEQKDEKSEDGKKDDEQKKEADTPQYKPIEEVTDEIREILIKDKARAELIKRLGQVDLEVSDFGIKVFLPAKDQYEEEKETNPSLEFVPPVAPDFSKTAESLGLKLSETGLITLTEDRFQRSSLGQAVEMQAGRVRGRTVAEVIAPADFFQPHQLQNLANDEFFVAWKIDDKPEREPAFEEIRDRVLLAFRMSKARDQALERANQIAKLLRELNGDVNRLREKEGELESITIPPVALWSNAPMFSMQMMSRPGRVATELPGLHYPSDELRNATFELKEGEVTVAPNQPHDIYYVVLLNKRESASREDFARSRQFIEMQIQSEQQEKMYRDWLADLRREASGKLARVPAGN